ncbi:MAG: outer membrane beta-barrel protein [Bradyrhizobium sp.]|nr:outer membrane beta-barrel protein [Bradyrhizobium sp.]
MKKFAAAAILLALGAPAAMAADMPVKAPLAASVQVYNWTGFYGGVNVGYEWGKADWSYYNLAGQTLTRNPEGWWFGGHLGAQYQYQQFVLGIEGSWSGDITNNKSVGPDAPIFAAAFDAGVKFDGLITAGGRLGWVFSPQWMLYASGGWTQANVWSGYWVKGFPQLPVQVRVPHEGWYAGGGIDYLLTNWMYVGLEYRHIELDTELHSPTVIPATGSARYVAPSMDLVQLRLGFKISPGQTAPVVAKY